jgi:hypothetical protein
MNPFGVMMTRNKKALSSANESAFGIFKGCLELPKRRPDQNPHEDSGNKLSLAVLPAGVKELLWRLRQWLHLLFQRQLVFVGCFASLLSIGDQVNRYTLRSLIAFAF